MAMNSVARIAVAWASYVMSAVFMSSKVLAKDELFGPRLLLSALNNNGKNAFIKHGQNRRIQRRCADRGICFRW